MDIDIRTLHQKNTGRGVWFFLMFCVLQTKSLEERKIVIWIINTLRIRYYCKYCREHFEEMCENDPPENHIGSFRDLFNAVVTYHNGASINAGNPLMTMEECEDLYLEGKYKHNIHLITDKVGKGIWYMLHLMANSVSNNLELNYMKTIINWIRFNYHDQRVVDNFATIVRVNKCPVENYWNSHVHLINWLIYMHNKINEFINSPIVSPESVRRYYDSNEDCEEACMDDLTSDEATIGSKDFYLDEMD